MASSPKIDDLKKKFDENPRRYFAPLANEYRKAGEVEQAIAICREYLPQQPGHMSGHIVFGQALFEARQLDEAKTVFETALSLDPENLIALKHLGDITLKAGDREAAKGWYKRVLEADPRNEETQAQLKAIEAAEKGGSAPTPVASLSTQPTQPVPAAKSAAATSAPTVVMTAVKPPAMKGGPPAAAAAPKPAPAAPPAAPAAAAPTATSPTAEIRLEGLTHGATSATKPGAPVPAVAATVIMEAPHGVTPVQAGDAPVVAPTIGLESTAMASPADAPPLDSFSLEGLESTSLAAPPAPPAPPSAAAAPPTIELDLPAAPPPAQPPAPAAEMPAIDLDFAPPAAPAPPPAAVPAPEIELAAPVAPPADEPGLVDLQVDLPPVPAAAPPVAAAPPPPPPAIEPPPPAMAAPAAPADLPMIDVDAPAVAPPAAAEAAPFVTETMAELYLQQGHRDEALRVYRALLEQRPGDAALQAKVVSLEAPPPPAAPAAPAMLPIPQAQGPSIRSILLLIAERRPGHRPEGTHQNGGAPAMAAEPEMRTALPVSTAASGALASRLASDALAALWNNATPNPGEESAAVMLAMAFAGLDGMEQTAAGAGAAGASAQPAPGSVAPPSSFSFDKFFSQRVTAEHSTPSQGVAAAAESQEDVAKFTRWLEGLKQQ